MIRAATLEDMDQIVSLGKMMHEESNLPHEFSEERVRETMESHINSNGVVFVYEEKGRIVAGIAGGVQQAWYSDELIGYDLAVFVAPTMRNGIIAFDLLTALEKWCKLMGANYHYPGVSTGSNVEKAERFYKAVGYEYVGPILRKELKDV